MPGNYDILIIGGGIWGLSTAYHLARTGQAGRIGLIERNPHLADETTRQAAGQIGQMRSSPAMVRGVQYTLELYSSLREQTGHDPAFQRSGSVHIALTPQRAESFPKLAAGIQSLGVDARLISSDEVRGLAPTVNCDIVHSALHLPADGYVEARPCALALGRAAVDLGVEIIYEAPVRNIRNRGGRVDGVETDQGVFYADNVVVTSGPWTRLLAEFCGISIAACPIRLQQARTVPDPQRPDGHPVVRIPDHSCYLRPEKEGYLFGCIDEGAKAFDETIRPDFRTSEVKPSERLVKEAQERLEAVFPGLKGKGIEEYRQGLVTCTPDGKYLLGPVPEVKGLWLATGCGAQGIAGSGAVGAWLASWIVRHDPGEDLNQFAPERFDSLSFDSDQLRESCRRVFASYYSLDDGSGATYGDISASGAASGS